MFYFQNSVLPSLRYFPDGGEGREYGPPAPPPGIGGQQTASSDSMQWSICSSTPADPWVLVSAKLVEVVVLLGMGECVMIIPWLQVVTTL